MEDHDEIGQAAAFHAAGRNDDAELVYREILQRDPNCADAWRGMAWLAIESQQLDGALKYFGEAARRDANDVESWANLGALYRRRGQLEKSLESYQRAVALVPSHVELTCALADVLKQAGRLEKAAETYRTALAQAPGNSELHHRLGNTLQELDRFDEAIQSLTTATRLEPSSALCWSNLGIAQHRKGEITDSITSFRRSLELQPDAAQTHFFLAMSLLLSGQFREGWPEYEYRADGTCQAASKPIGLPLWQGDDSIVGKTLLIAAEQGLGDSIMCVRFIQEICARFGCKTILQCQSPLKRLLENCHGIDRIVDRSAPLPNCHAWVPLMSLPSVLVAGKEQLRADKPYIAADPERIRRWTQRLVDYKSCFTIGVSWQGDPTNDNDRSRSMRLAEFEPLASLPGVQLVSLQKGPGTEQIAEFHRSIVDFGVELDRDFAFLDTAALMQAVDLVICSDSAVAHLAGATGTPVWIALQHIPEWRWQLHSSECLWYPSARLFRQPTHGDWASVFAEIREELRQCMV